MAEVQTIASIEDILGQVGIPSSTRLDTSVLDKGVDNYHVDVELSPTFVFKTREMIENQVKRVISGQRLVSGNTPEMGELRDSYTDMIKVTLHRIKTDLTVPQICFLQFAVVKFVIQAVRAELDEYRAQLDETQSQQQFAGSRSLLTTQERISWFRKHYNDFLFRANRSILKQFQREENNQLRKLRSQILGGQLTEAVNLLYNPMLFAMTPQDPVLLLESYAVWPGTGFSALNLGIEKVMAQALPSLPVIPLRNEASVSVHAEVYDEIGGLFACQALLGGSEDQKEIVQEDFSWLEQPGHIRLLFDELLLNKHLLKMKETGGIRAQWSLKADIKKLGKILQSVRKEVDQQDLIEMFATYTLRDQLTSLEATIVDIDNVVEAVASRDAKKIQATVDESKEGGPALIAKLLELSEEFERSLKESENELLLKVLTDVCRYRLHLKYYRFAHRVFNRLTVITDEHQLHLARAGGHLYRFMDSEEVKQVASEEPEIIHHTILKADVRGSTTVTQELIKKELNPASYFSLRFFDPINERLAIYGASKVFIEGDAVILGTYEYDGDPAQWYSVSRACGMAKEMLDIVNSKNSHSAKTGLPSLEIGIGICYSADKPLFLFDERRPIMISSAIGDADRMSSCSWKLRETFDSGDFNVEVLEIDEGDRDKGEKGQDVIRYNVNGILLDVSAFEKLKEEVKFSRIKIKSSDRNETMFVGKFPDVAGKERHLVIREGHVGLWKNETAMTNDQSEARFYELLPNSKLAGQIVSLAEKKSEE